MSKRLPTTTKKKIVKEYINGTSVQNLSTQYGVSRGSIYNWIELYDTRKSQTTQENNTTMNQRDYLRLQDKYNRAKKINEILYKANCTLDSPTVIKVAEIKRLSSEYSLSILCEALKVSKSSYYIAADENHKTTYSEKRKEMTPLIINKFNDSNQTLGAAKIAALLRMDGYEISNKLVADIMRIEGLFSMRGGAKKRYQQSISKKENMVKQQFTVSRPNEIWVSDVTEFVCKKHKYYLCVILDLYARKVVAYRISNKNSTNLTKGTFKKAYEIRKPDKGLIIHTDRGCNFTSKSYYNYLTSLGAFHSFSRRGVPYDNSVCEAFFKTLKQEEIYRYQYTSQSQMKKSIDEYVHWYNNERPHSYLNNKTPDFVEKQYFENETF